MPPSRLLALLQSLQGDSSGGADYPSASYPQSRRPFGLFGGQYDAYMARAGAGRSAATGTGDAYDQALLRGPVTPAAQQNVQLAWNDASCPSCHGGAAPPPPPISIPLPRAPTWPVPPGMDSSLLPPPLSGAAAAGWLAGILSGPQVSQFSPPRGPPPPGADSGAGDESNYPKQCEVQFANDQAICASLPPGARDRRRKCWESQNERRGYCNKSRGEVGRPLLRTR